MPTTRSWIAHIKISLQASEIQMYCEPAQSVNDVRIQGEHAAISAGDIVWACLNRLGYCQEALWLTNNLASVDEVIYLHASISSFNVLLRVLTIIDLSLLSFASFTASCLPSLVHFLSSMICPFSCFSALQYTA